MYVCVYCSTSSGRFAVRRCRQGPLQQNGRRLRGRRFARSDQPESRSTIVLFVSIPEFSRCASRLGVAVAIQEVQGRTTGKRNAMRGRILAGNIYVLLNVINIIFDTLYNHLLHFKF